MKRFRRFAVLAMTLVFLAGCQGCAGVTTVVNDIGGFLTGTAVPDVCKAASYYTEYVQGVVEAVTMFPAVNVIIGPYVTVANEAIAALNSACQSGALESTIQADMLNIDNLIQQINAAVGNAKSAGLMK